MVFSSQGHGDHHYIVDSQDLRMFSHGVVRKGRHPYSNEEYVLKKISRRRGNSMQVASQEVAIMRQLDHPNILRLFEILEAGQSMTLVYEFCSGGNLLEGVNKLGHLSEMYVSSLARQMFGVVQYLHVYHKLCHRDLRLDNFFLTSPNKIEQGTIKLIDFAVAKFIRNGRAMTTKVGSLHYVSPQMLDGKYDQSCDIWSCGVMCYIALCGCPPFAGESEPEVRANIKKADLHFQERPWHHVSDAAKDLIRTLLTAKCSQRCTVEQALNHHWIKDKRLRACDLNLHKGYFDHLRCYAASSKFKQAALHAIAIHAEEDRVSMLRDVFNAFDADCDGIISREEMLHGISEAGVEDVPDDFLETLTVLAGNDSGATEYTDFLAAFLEKYHYLDADTCLAAFNIFDRDQDGYIDQDELSYVLHTSSLGDDMDLEHVEDLIKEYDVNGDGKIDFEEFMLMMLKSCSPRRETEDPAGMSKL
jgi:calcium-dependent protein kinase